MARGQQVGGQQRGFSRSEVIHGVKVIVPIHCTKGKKEGTEEKEEGAEERKRREEERERDGLREAIEAFHSDQSC